MGLDRQQGMYNKLIWNHASLIRILPPLFIAQIDKSDNGIQWIGEGTYAVWML